LRQTTPGDQQEATSRAHSLGPGRQVENRETLRAFSRT